MLIQHPGGGTGRYLVCARNISAGGLSFIHGGYIHPASDCKILLPRRDGSPIAVNGTVMHCRHVEGAYHEIGVQFTEEIDPMALLSENEEAAAEDERSLEMPALEGRILIVDQSKADRRLMTHQLSVTGLAMTMVDTPGAAIDAVRKRHYEMMLCDLNLEHDAVEMIRKVRGAEFRGPIVVVTAENSPTRLADARAAGANEIIGKPYNPVYLASLLAEWLQAPAVEHPIYSTLEERPGMAELVADFVDEAQRKAGQIEKAVRDDSAKAMRETCMELLGSGSGFGFAAVTEAARDAITSLDTAAETKDAHVSIRRLVAICRRLRCAGASRPTGNWRTAG